MNFKFFPNFRLRLLPLTIIAIVVMLGARVVDLWTIVTDGRAAVVFAESNAGAAQAKDEAAPAKAAAPAQKDDAAQPKPAAAPANGSAPAAPAQPAGAAAEANESPASGFSSSDDESASPDEMSLLEGLRQRREQLDQRSKDLDQREALLAAAEQRFDQKMTEMQDLKKELEVLLGKVSEQQQAELARLVKVYETMKPKDAAAIFGGLDMPVLLNVLQQMKEQKAAPILAAMDPSRAQEVTALLADRGRLPKVPDMPAPAGQ